MTSAFRPSVGSTFLNVAVFAATFLVLSVGVAWCFGDRGYVWSQEFYHRTLNYIAEHPETNVVFIGGSRFGRGVSPRAFDARAQALRWNVKSANLNLSALSLREQLKAIDEVLARVEKLDMLVLEAVSSRRLSLANMTTWRSLYFSDLATYRAGLRNAMEQPASWPRRLLRLVSELPALALRQTYYGGLSKILFFPPVRLTNGPTIVESTDVSDPTGLRVVPGKAPIQNTRDLATELSHRQTLSIQQGVAFTPLHQELADALARRGVRVIFVTMPNLASRDPHFHESARVARNCISLSFLSPEENPLLYEKPQFWYNGGHLHAAGARYFSTQLAEQIFAYVARRASAPP